LGIGLDEWDLAEMDGKEAALDITLTLTLYLHWGKVKTHRGGDTAKGDREEECRRLYKWVEVSKRTTT